jgi:RecB family exonuclease
MARLTRVRGPSEVVLAPELAPTLDELGRALAAGGVRDPEAALDNLGLTGEPAARLAARLRRASERRHPLPRDLRHPLVHESLSDRPPFGASTLETYSVCSYRWFVDHELRPEPLDPFPEPLEQGTVVHMTLQRLYAEPPGGGPIPAPDTLGEWLTRARELLREIAEEEGLGPHDAARRAGLERMETLVGAFLARESRRDWELAPRPELLEAGFGTDTEAGPLELGDFRMRGSIDRVDVGVRDDGTRIGVVRDYKLSREVTAAAKLEDERKLQLQLYMLALRRLWGIEPIGGLYEPLGAAGDAKPRGMLLDDERGGLLPDRNLTSTDFLAAEEFDAALARAQELAATAVDGMRAGKVDRNPVGGTCPRYCSFQPICRRERAALEALEDEAPRAEENGAEAPG